jgi:hypothetical protein
MTELTSGIDTYGGTLLNHLEMLYQPGERNLAVSFCEMLGWSVTETDQKSDVGSTYMIVRFEPAESSYLDNVMFLSEMRPEHVALEKVLAVLRDTSPELASVTDAYAARARTYPFGIPHFGIRYRSFDAVEEVLDRFEHSLSSELKHRVTVTAVRPNDSRAMVGNLIQVFVYTDVICTGMFTFGQLIELQGQNRPVTA